jgi:hypothetical protein
MPTGLLAEGEGEGCQVGRAAGALLVACMLPPATAGVHEQLLSLPGGMLAATKRTLPAPVQQKQMFVHC